MCIACQFVVDHENIVHVSYHTISSENSEFIYPQLCLMPAFWWSWRNFVMRISLRNQDMGWGGERISTSWTLHPLSTPQLWHRIAQTSYSQWSSWKRQTADVATNKVSQCWTRTRADDRSCGAAFSRMVVVCPRPAANRRRRPASDSAPVTSPASRELHTCPTIHICLQ